MTDYNNYNSFDGELDFDGEIEQDAQEFLTLLPGDYKFTVTDIEKTRSKGEGKLPPTNMVIVTCYISTPQGSTSIKEYLVLHSKMEWKLSQFFGAIGQKKKGEKLKMNWNTVIGSTGYCQVINEENNGQTYNSIKRFILPDNYDQQGQYPQAKQQSFTPGQF